MKFEEYIRKLGVLDTIKDLESKMESEVAKKFNDYLDLARAGELRLHDEIVQHFFSCVANGEYEEKETRAEITRLAVYGIRSIECASEYSNNPSSLYMNYAVDWNDAPIVSACLDWYWTNEGSVCEDDLPRYSLWGSGRLKGDDVFCQYDDFICKLKGQIMNWITYFLMDNPIQCAEGEYWVLSEIEDWKYFISYLQKFLLSYTFYLASQDYCFLLCATNPFERFALRYSVAHILGKDVDLATYAKSLEVEDWILYYYDETLFPDVYFGSDWKVPLKKIGGTVKPYYTKGALNLHWGNCAIDIECDEDYLEKDTHGDISLDKVYFAERGYKHDLTIQDGLARRLDKFLYDSVD